MKPAIIVVGYNRVYSLQRLLDSIKKASYPSDNITLIISIDYHPSNQDIIRVAEDFDWQHGEKIISTHEQRMGLKAHVLECGDYSRKYGCIIVLEDDLAVAEDYYYYTVAAQEYYQDNDRIAGVALYRQEWNDFSCNAFRPIPTIYSSFFRQSCESWGQSWTEKQWNKFREWLKENPVLHPGIKIPKAIYSWPETSWGKYFCAYVVENDMFFVFPYIARSTCFSEVGQHTGEKTIENQVCLMTGIPDNYLFPNIDQSVHYDIFFENLDLQRTLEGYTHGEKCRIDLYGKHTEGDERYLLSTIPRPFKVLKSYGLEVRPPEVNVIKDIPGNDIFLYDTTVSDISPRSSYSMDAYDLDGYKDKEILIQYCKKLIAGRVKEKVKGIIRK